MPHFDLTGKVAIVTGGGSGIGREIALEYAASGAAVVVTSNVGEQDEAVAKECRDAGGRALAMSADVRDESAVRALVGRCLDELGRVDVLVAAAGLACAATRTGGGTFGRPGRSNSLPATTSTRSAMTPATNTRRRSSWIWGMTPMMRVNPSRVRDGFVSEVG
jgi:NAD(P)-dependent dehydrogenase (short-subunit alcohol dehydrogenase family)